MLELLTPTERIDFIKNLRKERESNLEVFQDYYEGTGKQWDLKNCRRGLKTRSGRYVYDIDRNLSIGNDYPMPTEEALLNANKNSVQKKHEWAEVNIIKTAIDEKARTVRGRGQFNFTFDNITEIGTKMFNDFWKVNRGGNSIIDLAKKSSIFNFSGATIMNDKLVILNPKWLYQTSDSVIYFYYTSRAEAQDFLMASSATMDGMYSGNPNDSILFIKECTNFTTTWYVAGEFVTQEVHRFPVNPIVIFPNNSMNSDVAEDIPEQDIFNVMMTRVLETFKHHLSPAVTVHSDAMLNELKAAATKGIRPSMNTGPGVVTFMESNGDMKYHQWNGLPQGISEELDRVERLWSARRGISLKQDHANLPESAAAKREARRVLYNIANDMRDVFEVSLDNLAQLYFAQRGVNVDVMTNIKWPNMVELDEKEIRDIALTDYSVHQSPRRYLEDIGWTDEEIDIVLADGTFQPPEI